MKRKLLSVSLTLQAIAYTFLFPLHHAAAQQCGSSGMRFDPRDKSCSESVEKKRAEDKKPKPLEEPKYPFKSGFLQMADTSTGQNLVFSISSSDGKTISVVYADKNKPPLVINTSSIVSWKSGLAGQGSDSSGAISSLVVGALFFWPMMLLAPFETRNYSITGFEVNYIDEFGKNRPLIFATLEDPRPLLSLLKFSTGLDAGVARSEDETKIFYQEGLKASLQRLELQRMKIMIVNNRRPWCSYLDLSKQTEDVSLYKQYLADVKQLQKNLGVPLYDDFATLASDAQWEKYLIENPGTKVWAATFPQQAEKMKACK